MYFCLTLACAHIYKVTLNACSYVQCANSLLLLEDTASFHFYTLSVFYPLIIAGLWEELSDIAIQFRPENCSPFYYLHLEHL